MEIRRSGGDEVRLDDGSAPGRRPQGARRMDGERLRSGLEKQTAAPRPSREAITERLWAEVDALPEETRTEGLDLSEEHAAAPPTVRFSERGLDLDRTAERRRPPIDREARPEALRPLNDDELQEVGRRVLEILDPEAWRRADIPQRMRMAQQTHAFIRQAYGLDASPLLYDLNLPPQVAGRFDPGEGIVSINANLLDDDHPGELLDTLAHENAHAVQVQVVREAGGGEPGNVEGRGPQWSAARRWSNAWKEYDAGNAEAYFQNRMEKDARRAGLQLAGNGYWRAYMERLATTQGDTR